MVNCTSGTGSQLNYIPSLKLTTTFALACFGIHTRLAKLPVPVGTVLSSTGTNLLGRCYQVLGLTYWDNLITYWD